MAAYRGRCKDLTRTTLITKTLGQRYDVPQHCLEEAVRQWLERQSNIFLSLADDATWSFEWGDNDDGTVYVTVAHLKATTETRDWKDAHTNVLEEPE